MDTKLLASHGVTCSGSRTACLKGFGLCIGERATLVRRPGKRAYGILAEVASGGVDELYADAGLKDYRPEDVCVELSDGTQVNAVCYNLPLGETVGANTTYAKNLLEIAARLGFPDSYLDDIRLEFTRKDPSR